MAITKILPVRGQLKGCLDYGIYNWLFPLSSIIYVR